jgi:hypothetical protein
VHRLIKPMHDLSAFSRMQISIQHDLSFLMSPEQS